MDETINFKVGQKIQVNTPYGTIFNGEIISILKVVDSKTGRFNSGIVYEVSERPQLVSQYIEAQYLQEESK